MVSSYESDAVRVSYFEAEKQQKRFERVETAVHKVACRSRWSASVTFSLFHPTSAGQSKLPPLTHEKIVGVRYVAAHAKQLHQIMELPVYVPAYRYRRVHSHHVGLFDEEFPCFVA